MNVKRYTATEGDLIKLGKRALCRLEGHEPEEEQWFGYTLNGEDRNYKCARCDARFEIVYPKLDYETSEE